MKLYIEMRNKFLGISAIILAVSLVVIFKFKINELGYFLLGIFASTLIIAIQSNMSVKVEESKLLIGNLKEIRDLCYKFDEFNTFSIYQVLPKIIELWGLNLQTQVESKKNIVQLSGK